MFASIKASKKLLLRVLGSFVFLIFAFQNCAKKGFDELPSIVQPQAVICTEGFAADINGECVAIEQSCTLSGTIIKDGSSITTYESAIVEAGQSCLGEKRTCVKKSLSGSFTNLSCKNKVILKSCNFNGQNYASGQFVMAYENQAVGFGQTCKNQKRICNDGQLSGTYAYSSCSVTGAASCNLNGNEVAHGGTITAYKTATVAFGATCAMETRKCTNGTLSGSYTQSSCTVGNGANCDFNGLSVVHGGNVKAYQAASVPSGSSCQSQTRTCNNGQLSGTYKETTCKVEASLDCNIFGKTIANNSSVTAYEKATVPFGSTCLSQQRKCINGQLSGTYSVEACNVESAVSCNFNGNSIAHNGTVTAYLTSSVSFGGKCASETRKCSNGVLSGTYSESSCKVEVGANCDFNGTTVQHGQSTTAYQSNTVAFGSSCQSQNRLCTNGSLSGSYGYSYCSEGSAASCSYAGKEVAHGQSLEVYKVPQVAYGEDCANSKVTISCNNGKISDSTNYFEVCTVASPKPNIISVGGYTDGTYYHTHGCYVKKEALFCSGTNTNGQLGVSNSQKNTNVLTPVTGWDSGVSSVVASFYHTCGIRNGGAYCWGYNGNGEAGTGSASSTRIQAPLSTPMANLTSDVKTISVGSRHSCAIKNDGQKVYCWGNNSDGELGRAKTVTYSASPVSIENFPPAGTKVVDIGLGIDHSCAIVENPNETPSKQVYCWGKNDYYQLGSQTPGNVNYDNPVPTLVSYFKTNKLNVEMVTGSNRGTCALTKSLTGTTAIYCWGLNDSGRLGIGLTPVAPTGCTGTSTSTRCWVPQQVKGLNIPVKVISHFDSKTNCVIDNVGTVSSPNNVLKCWGDNGSYQLGNQGTADSNMPLIITIGQNVGNIIDVSMNLRGVCAVKKATNRDVYCWGANTNYFMGAHPAAFPNGNILSPTFMFSLD